MEAEQLTFEQMIELSRKREASARVTAQNLQARNRLPSYLHPPTNTGKKKGPAVDSDAEEPSEIDDDFMDAFDEWDNMSEGHSSEDVQSGVQHRHRYV